MSEVNANDLTIIDGEDDVLHTYEGAGSDAKAGIEIEQAFFDPSTPDLKPMSLAQNKDVRNIASNALGSPIHNEPTSETLEVATIADKPENLQKVLDDANKQMEILRKKAEGVGVKRSYFQTLPERTAEELLARIVNKPRFQAFFVPPREDMKGFAAYFSVCKSTQVSISYHNTDHMLENVRRLYFMAPFLFLLTDNAAAFDQGQKFSKHAGMYHRSTLGERGQFYPYLFTAKTGDEYIRAHIDHVMNHPLFAHYNHEGDLLMLPTGEWTSFNELRKQGLNTATNYYFSESILWPDVKIAALKDENGQVVNHRHEARMFGVGLHQHQTALLITAGLAFNPDFAQQVDELLEDFEFSSDDPETTLKNLKKAYEDSINHDNRFLDIPYGSGSMKDFAKKFADLLEDAYLESEFEDALAPILSICRTGCTDTKVNSLMFDTLEKTLDFQRNFDASIFENPNNCAHLLFAKEIKKQGLNSCIQNAA